MKKILILLSFLSVFAFAVDKPIYVYNPPYSGYDVNSSFFNKVVCSAGKGLILTSTSYLYNSYKEKSVYGGISIPIPTIYFSKSPYSIRFLYYDQDSYKYYLKEVVKSYSCGTISCPVNKKWEASSQTCIPDCPIDTTWNNDSQTCVLNCKPWQRLNEINGGYAQECEDMCPTLDIYTPLTGSDYIDGLFGGMFPWDSSTCKTRPDVNETECNAHSGETYHWVCPEPNAISMLFGYMTGGPTHDDCYCGNEYKSYPPAVPYFGPGKPRTSPKIDPKALPWSKYPKLSETLESLSDDALDTFSDWLKYLERKGGSTDVPESTPPKNYDYTDTHIERDPVTGKETFVPDFIETPSTTGSPSITTNSFNENISNNPYRSTIDTTLPQTDLSISPQSYTAGVQTVTRTQFNLPETAPAGSLVTTETVPTNLTGGTTVKSYNWDVINPTTGTTRYTSVNGDTTTTVDSVINTDGSTKYTVTTSTPYTNSDGRGYVNNNTYNYTTSGGTVTYISNPVSTTTGSTGTYNNNVPTNTIYNYNNSNQNIDELLNFEPKVTDTGMTKPFNEMVKAQFETLDFIDSLKNSINGIKLDFDAMMLKLQNPPTLQPKSGNCVMTAVFVGKTYTANPCTAFYPYREMIRLFFTIVGMFYVGKFAVENLK